jgi:hypothetical protein
MEGVKCGGRVRVGGDLIHKSWLIEFLAWGRFLAPPPKRFGAQEASVLLVGFCFQRLVLLSVHATAVAAAI